MRAQIPIGVVMTTREAKPGESGTLDIEFFFDPGCPWAWITSRWIHEVAAVRDISVHWRSYSLGMLNEGHDNPAFADKRAMAKKALRMIEALEVEGRNDDIGRFYTEMGTRFHVNEEPASDELMIAAAKAAGVDDKLDVAEDESWDPAVRAALDEAKGMVGADTGTPVIAWGEPRRAIFGPVLSPAPTGEKAGEVWDAMVTLTGNADFWEIKRGRDGGPDFS
ncbi:MAG: DsbA family protein [Chloroflexi bacterium]|nr:DsbA family protein [Chloroflexota bacterium]